MFCNKCGRQIDNNAKFCNYCGNTVSNNILNNNQTNNTSKTKKKVYQKWWFWLIIIIVILALFWGVIISNIEVSVDPNYTNEYFANKEKQEQEEKERQEQEEQTKREEEEKRQQEEEKQKQEIAKKEEDEYKENCKKYEYKDIARNPQNYEGKLVTFDGEVIQVLEGYFNTVNFRINVTKNEYDFWEDTVYCSYTYSDNESKILEDDIVTLYGECEGTTTYTSILGQKITVPKINIKYIELIQE